MKKILIKSTPHESRLKDYFTHVSTVKKTYEDPLYKARLERMMEMDIAFKRRLKEINKKIPGFLTLCYEGSSGFRMAKILRSYFIEYANRILSHGPLSLPSSFNVVEAFFRLNEEFRLFELRKEKEHLLRLHDYYEWYTGENNLPEDPQLLTEVMEENKIYSYDLTGDTGEFAISNEGSTIAIAGVSMIRHDNELSIILLSGENPPNPPDEKITSEVLEGAELFRGHENIKPDSDLSIKDRYLDGYNGFSKVLILTRLNLIRKKHDVRYINIDCGKSYSVITDDPEAYSELPYKKRVKLFKQSEKEFTRYDQAFSALASLIYLPVMFIAESESVIESKFVTSLFVNKRKHYVKKATKQFGKSNYHLHRIVKCMASKNTDNLVSRIKCDIDPPKFSFESKGFWKPLESNQIGTDKHGNSIVGKTWVERVDTYIVNSPDSFIISNQTKKIEGSDPGVIYILRSASHSNDIYKIGLTRRDLSMRAKEIGSTTGVPLPFGVLASWEVGNCRKVEKEVHSQLKDYRINTKREFFRVSLSAIVSTIHEIISRQSGDVFINPNNPNAPGEPVI
jgi:hypothetical protein